MKTLLKNSAAWVSFLASFTSIAQAESICVLEKQLLNASGTSELVAMESSADYVGAAVVDAEGEKIGSVVDVKFDGDKKFLRSIYVAIGEWIGADDRIVELPVSALTFDELKKQFKFNALRSDLGAVVD